MLNIRDYFYYSGKFTIFAFSYLKQWKNEAKQRKPLVFKSLPIEETCKYKMFFMGF
jgi:hypothetical protein